MKLIHLGDLHLGKSLKEMSLLDDQKDILQQILDVAKEKNVQAILLAGDIYDRSDPSEAAINLFDWFLNQAVSQGLQIFAISGNHDSDDRLEFGSRLFAAKNVYISSKFRGTIAKQVREDEFGKLNIYMLPFVKASTVRNRYPDEKILTYEDAVRVAIEKSGVDPAERNVILSHQFVIGKTKETEIAGSEGVSVLQVGTVEQIHADCFDAFDYAALGHIHSPQKIDREEVRYSGSILKYSLQEADSEKSVPVVEIREKGNVQIELVDLKPKRDLRHITGPMKELLKNAVDTEDFIYATLTDEIEEINVMDVFRTVYKNTLKIEYRNSHTADADQVDLSLIGMERPFSEIVSEFYQKMYGTEMSEEEMAAVNEIAREAGILE